MYDRIIQRLMLAVATTSLIITLPRAGPGIHLPGLISTAFAPGLRNEIYLLCVRTYVCYSLF